MAGRLGLQRAVLNLVLEISSTVGLLNSPWSSPKNVRFRKFWKSYLDQKLLRITNPVSDLTARGPVVLCDFSKLRFQKSPYDFLNLYGRFCPYNPPYKSASVVPRGIEFPLVPRRPIFEKCSHLREKGGVLMLYKTTLHLGAKAQYSLLYSSNGAGIR
jgi:hypothetical protein